MAKFPKKASPAREALEHFGRWLPGIWRELEALRLQSGASPADAPVNAAFIETIRQALAKNVPPGTPLPALDNMALRETALVYSALAAWRYTQGIYRFDPDLYAAVTDTPVTDLPVHVLDHIPEWCIYIETPALKLWGDSVAGAWVRVAGGSMLCIYAQTEINPLAPALFHISLSDGVERSIQQAVARLGGDESDAAEASRVLPHIINLALYLCASNDITGKFGQPGNPEPVRTRRAGWQLFPADGIRAWDVGVRMGSALRAAYQRARSSDSDPTGRQVRAHVRRAHWHTFVSGPRLVDGRPIPASDRKRELRWVPPIPVNIGDVDGLPATIRPVK